MPRTKNAKKTPAINADDMLPDMDRVAMIVGNNLRRLRRDRRLSLSEMARVSNIAKATLSNLEAGTGNPTITTLSSLAAVLGVPAAELLENPAPRLIRADEGPFSKGSVTSGRLLTRHHSSSVDIHEVVFKADKNFESKQPESDAIEQVYVLSGNLRIEIGDEIYHLDPGDLIQYALRDGAKITALGKDAKVMIIMAYTLRSDRIGSSFS